MVIVKQNPPFLGGGGLFSSLPSSSSFDWASFSSGWAHPHGDEDLVVSGRDAFNLI